MRVYLAKSQLSTLFTARFAGSTLSVALLYFLILLLLPNVKIVMATLESAHLLSDKLQFLLLLIVGSVQSNPLGETALILLTALLVGMNLTLFLKRSGEVKKKNHLVFGETILGAAATGCSSCGTSLLASLAIGAGISIAPLQILLIQLLAIALLTYSFLASLNRLGACRIKR